MTAGAGRLRLILLRMLAWYLRHAPDHPGRWRLVLRAVSMAPLLVQTPPRVIRLRDGSLLRTDGTSQTSRVAFLSGEYEPETARLIERTVGPGDVVVDVGANVGFFTILAGRLVGPSGRVLAFEPVTRTREQLVANVALNRLGNVSVFAEALGSTMGQTQLYEGPADNTGLASLRPLDGSAIVEVRGARFDDLVDPATPVRLVKIDVEGAELEVLRGMAGCLRARRPDLILEVTDRFLRAMNASADELWEFLTSHGYTMHRITHDGGLLRLGDLDALRRSPGQFNAFCTAR